MLPISPVLQYFPRHDLHILVEGNGVGLERRGYSVGDAESKVLKWNCHRLSRICEAKKTHLGGVLRLNRQGADELIKSEASSARDRL